MNTPDTRPCFGVCCDMHGRCARYEAVTTTDTAERIATCFDGDSFPGFVERVIPIAQKEPLC